MPGKVKPLPESRPLSSQRSPGLAGLGREITDGAGSDVLELLQPWPVLK